MITSKNQRRFLTEHDLNLPKVNLLAVQKESWEVFLKEGIGKALNEISPISDFTGKNWELSFGEYKIDAPEITSKRAREKGLSFSSPLRISTSLLNKRTGKVTTQEVFLGDMPQMTSEGTFIINGIERAVVNQIVRSPGVYFSGEVDQASGRMLHKAEVRPSRGSWLEFEVTKADTIVARIDRRRKVLATTLLRAMGIETDEEIIALFGNIDIDKQHSYISGTLEKDSAKNREDALLEIYRKMRPGELVVLDHAQTLLESLFLDPRRYSLEEVGRYKVNKKLGLSIDNKPERWVLQKEDILATLRYLVGLQNGQGRVDDIDHLANRRIRCVGELVSASAFRVGLARLERSIKEKMSLTPTDEDVRPGGLVSARPVLASLNEFFRSNQLSAILDQTNPLSEIDNLRRLSVMGPGGITKERASFSIRDINASQYGRIDPVRSPEGPSIGLVTYLALYAKVNKYGFLEAPYRKVEKVTSGGKTKIKVTDEIVYLQADDEEELHISHAGIAKDRNGYILDTLVPFRYRGEFTEGPVQLVDLVDLTPRQVVGTSASLIPFLAHDEANRALMGTNMQCQAVPLVKPVAPFIGTGMEEEVASSMGRVILARNPGRVIYVDSERIEVALDKVPANLAQEEGKVTIEGKKEIYYLDKFRRTSQSTCFNQHPVVNVGDRVEADQILADGPATEGGELALGQNLLIAYTSFEGLGFEDAIVVSDRLVREDTLTSIHIEEYESSVVDTKLGPEELTRDIPNVAEGDLANLAEDGIIVVGAEVVANDILVGKIAPKGETELTSEERLLRAIFGEKAREVRDTSLRVPHGEHGIVVDVQILDREQGDELDPGTLRKVVVKVAQIRKVSVGDKVAGRHGNKGVISKIIPSADMPHLADGTPVDIIISPLSVLARMNLGQLLEAQIGWAAQKMGNKFAVPVFSKLSQEEIEKLMKAAKLPVSGKIKLYDGRTGNPFEEETVVGVGYIMKLTHMVEDKTHARSTGPYSLVTQQPLGGKAQMGGQRLGEMEVWALEAHRAAHTLQEMLTIKSDDIVGRARAFEAIVKGTDIPESTIPESFKVLMRELNSLGLSIDALGQVVSDKGDEGESASVNESAGAEAPEPKKGGEKLMDIQELVDFSKLRIKLASAEDIVRWSHGEVTKPETINYRTLKPEKDGLFDERIFGPTKDWECYCGKYKRIRYKGIICDKCGVEVTQSRVRRERMGHITLSVPVAHAWFFRGTPSKISFVLDIPPKALEQVIYFARYLVTSVEEKGRKEAKELLEKALAGRLEEIKADSEMRAEEIKRESRGKMEELLKKVKDKEQLALTRQETKLEERNQLTALHQETENTRARTENLFGQLADLVKSVRKLSLLSDEEYIELDNYGAADFFEAQMGAEAVLSALEGINLDELSQSLREELVDAGDIKKIKITKRLRLIDGMRRSNVDPRWMIWKFLPVLPPDLRPMVQLSGGRFATSDLNDLYRRVINRNNRLRHLLELGAPQIILRNEKRMLQEAVDSLIDASHRQTARRGRERQFLRSLSDMLRGKQGRFRQNLLGKRVDYSGRSVIVVGPELKLNQCGIPKEMALEIFKPFVLREMITRAIAPNVKSAKNMLERRPPEVFDILEEITAGHPVILNRAPTLHKLGMQAFYMVLIEGKAIRLHPCVCSGFGADFDGDQMAIHLPLSEKAREEAIKLMMPENNLLKPADGSPIAIPASKEMALGVYYLTAEDSRDTSDPKNHIFKDPEDAISVYQKGGIRLRQKIQAKINGEGVVTTVGRLLLNRALPKFLGFVNEPATASVIKGLFAKALIAGTKEEVMQMIDDIKSLGFMGGTLSGLSFGISDAQIHPDKNKMLQKTAGELLEIERNFSDGLITKEERKRLVQELWIETTEELADMTWQALASDNPIRTIIEAGVGRASREQVKQLAAMRGLVVDPLGKIVDLPTKSNFREGLSIFEYVTSARGSRKGLTDTAIKTADAGYLTRRLVDVAHDIIVRLEDCGTREGIAATRGLRPKTFTQRIVGRVAAEDIISGKKALVSKNQIITPAIFTQIDKAGLDNIKVRSPLTCQARYGMCALCYGWDLATKKMVELGTPLGVIAAQSIGEPGTQLTMRTKHSGGIVGLDVTQGLPRVEELFEARVPKTLSPLAEISGKVEVVEKENGYLVRVKNTLVKPVEEREYLIPLTANLLVRDGDLIEPGKQLSSGFLDIKEVLAVRGLHASQEYLVNEVQAVYESTGININDKHFEVIVRKMSDKAHILNQGDTILLPGEIVDKTVFEEENERVISEGGEPAIAQVMILGITRAALFTDSWLSAASFQNTTSVLTDASLLGKEDKLIGLKENVIIGRLIPTSPERARIPQNLTLVV